MLTSRIRFQISTRKIIELGTVLVRHTSCLTCPNTLFNTTIGPPRLGELVS